ncbi:MAG: hypothetical protein Sv326_0230 [Candidatus Fermentimicrarchaeum limneticum]|uniref:Uncharacterized protein n=1 Tax=Fermentimicrarchaeum limneticum TaxID=2795018 RepID=A0A7D5XBJ1_FERL1|nr:MAG: hypothetical protein Sv326_0230 [Candidatus Fermentimicrarchaeum limneticum]
MQKSGITRGLEESPRQENSGIARDLRGMHERTLISTLLRRSNAVSDTPLPTMQEINDHIEHLFMLSEDAQPSRAVNAGAGVSDVGFGALALNRGNVWFGIGVLATEFAAFVKNRGDSNSFKLARQVALEELEEDGSKIVSKLEYAISVTDDKSRKKELRKLVRETKELFSEIERRSKQSLTSVAGSRLEGIAGSVPGLLATIHPASPYKHLVDGVSSFAEGFIRGFPLQQVPPFLRQIIPPYPYLEFAVAAADVAIRGIAYIAASSVSTYILDWGIQKAHRDRSYETREGAEDLLKTNAGKLLDKVRAKCTTQP